MVRLLVTLKFFTNLQNSKGSTLDHQKIKTFEWLKRSRPTGKVLKIDDLVRIQLPLSKESMKAGPRYSEDIYQVSEIFKEKKPYLYKLRFPGDPDSSLSQRWYSRQLVKIAPWGKT